MNSIIDLSQGWTLRTGTGHDAESDASPVPLHLQETLCAGVACDIPGTVHAILLRAGLIDDPFAANNEQHARWVGHTSWTLHREVVIAEPTGHHVLEFDGIDTVAEVWWDGELLVSTRNMHRRYRLDLGDLATQGTHRLSIHFAAPEQEAVSAQERLGGSRPNPYFRPFESLRKVACNFGWDWGPDFPSAGLWRGVRLMTWATARLGDVRVDTVPAGKDMWQVVTTLALETDQPVTCRVRIGGQESSVHVDAANTTQSIPVEIHLSNPDLWWPRSHGTPHLYDHTVEILGTDGTITDAKTFRTGVREITLDTNADERGSEFGFVVNGVPVAIRGLNWIPDHAFPGETTREDLAARFTDAVEAHANMLRVWGGGHYESEDFYNLADEMGLLVWQDFAFACAGYSEDAELADEVAAEAEDNISRLQRRASLAIWCGNNECQWAVETWEGWPEWLDGRTWGARYYFDTLPSLVTVLDPRRPYWPGSPLSGSDDIPSNHDDYGCQHLWDIWNDIDPEHYLDHTPRFVSEFGYQGPPAWTTMSQCIGEEHMKVGDPVLLAHQKAEDGEEKFERGLVSHGGSSDDTPTWWWRGQHLQALAARIGVSHLRSLAPVCRGYIWWQLNDCWPVISWSLVDSAGRRKPAWYAMQQAAADRVVTLLGHGIPQLRLINDSPEPWETTVRLHSVSIDTFEVRTHEIKVSVPARGAVRCEESLGELIAFRRKVLLAEADGIRSAMWAPRELAGNLPAPDFDADAIADGPLWRVTVSARTPVMDLTLWVDRVSASATVDDALISLLPGESHTFVVTGAEEASADDFTSEAVLWYWGR